MTNHPESLYLTERQQDILTDDLAAHLHATLDQAVAAAYSWPADLPDSAILARLLALNAVRAGIAEGSA